RRGGWNDRQRLPIANTLWIAPRVTRREPAFAGTSGASFGVTPNPSFACGIARPERCIRGGSIPPATPVRAAWARVPRRAIELVRGDVSRGAPPLRTSVAPVAVDGRAAR